MIPMPIEHSQYQQNALHDSNVSRTTQLHRTSFLEYILYLRFETSQSCRPLLQKLEQRTNHLKESIRHSKNWRKELFGVPKNTLSTWKKKKDKIFEKYNSAFISKRVKPEKYKELKKDVHK